MKNIVLIIFAILFTNSYSQSQTHELNQQKYWSYRNRLKSQFLFTDIFDAYNVGSSLPASKLKYNTNPKTIEFGDAPVYLASYLQVLATEYALLKYYNLPVDNTLKDLFFAIEAIVRLDRNGEYQFRENGATPEDNDINGFFIRDDVDKSYIQKNWWRFDNLDTGWKVTSDFTAHQDYDDNPSTGNKYDMEMSKDNCWHLYIGFALISKLLDGVVLTGSNGATYDFAERIKKITNNIQYQLSGGEGLSHIWEIVNPADGHEIPENRGGKAIYYSYGFGIAGSEITGTDLHAKGSHTNLARTTFMDTWQWEDWDADDYGARALSTVGDVRDYDDFMRIFNEYQNKNIFSYPQFPLIHLILFPDLYSDRYRVIANSMLNDIKLHLDEAPMDGPGYDAVNYWSSDNTLIFPERRGKGSPGEKYNGLDYLLLHNLYYLAKKEILNLNSVSFPDYSFGVGSMQNPATIDGKNMLYDKTIPANSNVKFVSSNFVKLEPGFKATNGSIFNASIDSYEFNQISNLKYTVAFPINYIKFPENNAHINKNAQIVDVNENSNIDFLGIYPNPANDAINIEFSEILEGKISITDLKGTALYQSDINSNLTTIDISSFEKGFYLINIQTADKSYSKKFIKK